MIDLKKEKKVTSDLFGGFSDYIVYEGRNLKGWPVKIIVWGEIVADDFGLAIYNLNMKISHTKDNDVDSITPLTIPKWIKTTAGWWIEGHVSDENLRNTVRFLVENGIMII